MGLGTVQGLRLQLRCFRVYIFRAQGFFEQQLTSVVFLMGIQQCPTQRKLQICSGLTEMDTFLVGSNTI